MFAHERTEVSAFEALLVTVVCFGWAIVGSTAVLFSGFEGHRFSDARFVGIVVSELLFGSLALFILRKRGYAIATLYPAPTISGAALGIALYAAALFVGSVTAALIAGIVSSNPLHAMLQGVHPSLMATVAVAMVNGTYEEVFLLGFLLRGLRRYGAAIALGIALLVRVLYHTYQGPVGVFSVGAYGLVVSVFYLRTALLFPVVFAHILGDIIPFALMG